MHIVTMPMTRERVTGGASIRMRLVCMLEKAAVPRPPMISSTKARPYHGDSAIAMTPPRNTNEPCISARGLLKRSQPADSAMPTTMAPSGSAAASAPTKVGDTR